MISGLQVGTGEEVTTAKSREGICDMKYVVRLTTRGENSLPLAG